MIRRVANFTVALFICSLVLTMVVITVIVCAHSLVMLMG